MSLEPIVDFIVSTSASDREKLLHIMEVVANALILDCQEEKLMNDFTLALWKSIKMDDL